MSARRLAHGLAIAALGAAIAGATPLRAEPRLPLRTAAAGALAGIDATTEGPSVDERLEQIRARLQAALVYPPIARRLELTGVAWMRFSIDARGAAREIEVARSSGHPILDAAARSTVDRAGRLPWVYGRIEVPIRFSLDDPI